MKGPRYYGIQRVVFLSIIALLVYGCVTTSFRTSPNLTPREETQKILLMPMDVQLSTLTAGGVLKPEAEWTAKGKECVEEAIKVQMALMDIRLLCNEDIEKFKISAEEEEKRIQLIKLHEAVGHSILLHQYNPQLKLPGKNDQFNWSLGPKAEFLKEKYGADYALFVYLRDSYASGGRVAFFIVAAAFGVAIPLGQQVGFASLIDLRTGEVVWFNRLARGSGDLRTQEAAANSIKHLLGNFPQ
jgi:hypothetical protein